MDFYLSQIIYWACNFAPANWLFCSGQLLNINSNTALFALLGTRFGGNGQSTFGLPDLRGRVAIGSSEMGPSPTVQTYPAGAMGGTNTVTLNIGQMPVHNHQVTAGQGAITVDVKASTATATQQVVGTSGATSLAAPVSGFSPVNAYNNSAPNVSLAGVTASLSGSFGTAVAGGSQPHDNMMPYTPVNACICAQGLYPSRP